MASALLKSSQPGSFRPPGKQLIISIFVGIVTALVCLLLIKGPTAFISEERTTKYEGISEFEAIKILNEFYAKIDVTHLPPIMEPVDLEEVDLLEILPDIDKYPLIVPPVKDSFSIEIASSPEKAAPLGSVGASYNRWLVEMAERFNKMKYVKKGQPVSVSLRSLPSGLALDYIVSGKYLPDAFTPSNALWGDILKDRGVPHKLLAERLTGNVAGIVLEQSKYADFVAKYQEVTVANVAKAVNQGAFVMGYTNPMVSSTGANFMMSMLMSANPNNPLSEEAQTEYARFQNNIPFVAYTTLQMTEAARSGVLDGFVFELQQFVNSPELKANYVFTPFGVRHDNPVYALGDLSRDKIELLTLFISFCRYPEAQSLATKYGFNQNDSYKGLDKIKGQYIPEAQKLFKERKSGQRESMAVFVVDVSGSMAGAPLRFLKRSLIQGSKTISYNNFVGLVQFSDQVQIAVPISRFDLSQRSLFTGAVNNMSSGGGTAMFDALIVAAKMLVDAKAKRQNVKPMIIVLTDGESAQGHTFADVAPMARGLKIPIFTIGYNANLKTLKEVSAINEAASFEADTDDIVYKMQSFFNAEM
ncbi:MAG: VWA domain-containing protein [Deltaproteobacteria bacterium]|jgi:Ca-activated chloride channel family protein|nr:VWA domain-containing protein [Deltaproteobacteria bacterium]